MAREAWLFVPIGKGGVRPVGSKNRVTQGNQRNGMCFCFGDKVVLSCDSKKEREVIFNIVPLWSPRATRAESVSGRGALMGACFN